MTYHQYEVEVWVKGHCIKTVISALTHCQAKTIAEAQYPTASMITVFRQIN